MELVNIYIIRFEHFKTCLQILFHLFPRLCAGFGGNINFFPDSLESKPKLMLAVAIPSCGIKKTDSALICPAKELHSLLVADSLDWQRAKTILIHYDFRTSKSYRNLAVCHIPLHF